MHIIDLTPRDPHLVANVRPGTNASGLHCPAMTTPRTGFRMELSYISWDSTAGYGRIYDDLERDVETIELDIYDSINKWYWFSKISLHLITNYCELCNGRILDKGLPICLSEFYSEDVVNYIRDMLPNKSTMSLNEISQEFDRIKYQLYSSAKALDKLVFGEAPLFDSNNPKHVEDFLSWLKRNIQETK